MVRGGHWTEAVQMLANQGLNWLPRSATRTARTAINVFVCDYLGPPLGPEGLLRLIARGQTSSEKDGERKRKRGNEWVSERSYGHDGWLNRRQSKSGQYWLSKGGTQVVIMSLLSWTCNEETELLTRADGSGGKSLASV